MSHRFHPGPGDHEDAILFDECEDCDRRAGELGLGLNESSFARMWQRMADVEYRSDADHYRSDNEAKLGRQLYYVSLLLQRHPRVVVAP